MDQRGEHAIAPEPEMRLRLRADPSGAEETGEGLSDADLDARLWSESGATALAAVAGTVVLAAWGALAPWQVTSDRWTEVTWVEVTVHPLVGVAGFAAWLVASAIGYGAWALVMERRRPWPFGRGQGRVRVRAELVVVAAALVAGIAASVAVASGHASWIDAATADIDADRSPPAFARRLIAQADAFLAVFIGSRALLVAAMRRARPGRPLGWVEGATAR